MADSLIDPTDAAVSGGRERRPYFGRRKGRKLSPSRQALLADFLPSIAIQPVFGERCDPGDWFEGGVRSVWLEIGFGSGEHLAWHAARHPDVGIIGAEVFLNGIASLLDHIHRNRLRNVRICADDAGRLLDGLCDASLERVFLLFPDPWPKRRHWERRFLSPANLSRLARTMRSEAELRFASDDPVMIQWGLRHLTGHPQFRWMVSGPGDWRARPADWPATRYEAKALREGRQPHYFRFQRLADGDTRGKA